jgi:phenylalanyl-tRNA synthetase beta chain
VRLYEVGQGFRGRGQGLPEERPMVAAVVTGPRFAHAHDAAHGTLDFADAKGLWEGFLAEMGVDSPRWRAYSGPGWKPGAAAEVAGATSRIGWAGALSRALLQSWGIETPPGQDVHLFVALLDPLQEAASVRSGVVLPGRFPAVRRDLAFFVPVATNHEQVVQAMRGAGGEWLSDIEVFDIYTGPGTPEGMKSLAFAIRWLHPERTLTEAEVQGIQDRMTAAVAEHCGGRLRER